MSRYSNFAQAVFDSGLGNPLPVSTANKGPLVAGFHGARGGAMLQGDVDRLVAKHAKGKANIGIRLIPQVIGIDVDAHSGKRGDKSLRKLIKRHGKLPDTWVSTSRALPNGIMLYRVGAKLAGSPIPSSIEGMPDVDLVNYGDMYVQCAPSIHAKTGEEYRWEHTGTGDIQTSPPSLDELPKLPKRWQKAIMGQAKYEGFAAATPASRTAIASDRDDAVAYAVGVLHGTAELRGDHASRHKAVAAMVLRLTFDDDTGGIADIAEAWDEVMPDERGKAESRREFNNILKSAQQRADEPSPPAKSPAPKSTRQAKRKAKRKADAEAVTPVGGGFPLHVLPAAMRQHLDGFVATTQTQVDLAAPAMLAGLAAATAGGIVIKAPDGYPYGMTVYFVGVAQSSGRKSRIEGDLVKAPLLLASEALRSDGQHAYDVAESEVFRLTKIVEKAQKDGDDSRDIADYKQVVREAEAVRDSLVLPDFVVTDPTPEALEQVMMRQNGVALVSSAEGALIENLAGRFSADGASLAAINDGWSRSTIKTVRVSRDTVTIKTPHLGIVQLIQPTIVEKLGAARFERTGMLSRVWFTWPADIDEDLVPDYDGVPIGPRLAWEDVVREVMYRGWGQIETPDEMTLSPAARDLWGTIYVGYNRLNRKGAGIEGWWGKATEMATRAAGLLTLAEDPKATEIDYTRLSYGCEVIEYFGREAAKFSDKIIDPFLGQEDNALMRRIVKRIERHYKTGDEFTSSEMSRALKGGGYPVNADDVDPILAMLTERGVVSEVESKRKDTRKWRVLGGESKSSESGEKASPSQTKWGGRLPTRESKQGMENSQSGESGEFHTKPTNNRVSLSETPQADISDSPGADLEDPPEISPSSPLPSKPDKGGSQTLYLDLGDERLSIWVYGEADEEDFNSWLQKNPVVGFDIESTGLHMLTSDTLRLVQVGNEVEAWVIDADKYPDVARLAAEVPEQLIGSNIGFDIKAVAHHLGADWESMRKRARDTKTLAMLIDARPEEEGGIGLGLKALSDHYLGAGASDSDKALREEAKRLKIRVGDRFAKLPIDNEVYLRYAGADTILAARLYPVLKAAIKMQKLGGAVKRERKLARVVWDMERRGMLVDLDAAHALSDTYAVKEQDAMDALASHGVDSPNKNAQVVEAIKDEGVYELTKLTGGGAFSVATDVMTEAAAAGSAVAEFVTDAKKAKRYRTTYVEKIIEHAGTDGRLHASISPLQARTGRMSVSQPPLQQIPADDLQVRSLFVAQKGNVIVSADFGQIEARVLAALADDDQFTEDVVDGDIHGATAEIAFGKNYSAADRTMAKRINFGRWYGGGPRTLAVQTGASDEAVAKIIKAFDKNYPGIRRYSQQIQRKAEMTGLVRLPSGRVLQANKQRAYTALNYMIQGTARDLFVDAVLRLDKAGFGKYMLLPVHDEMLFSLPEEGIDIGVELIVKTMSGEFDGIPLPVDAGYGPSWAEADHG